MKHFHILTVTAVLLLGSGLARAFQPGDVNCDGAVNTFDIDPFVLALTDPLGYAEQFPACSVLLADINGDGYVNTFDIDPFVSCLTVGCPPSPPFTAAELAGNSLTAYPYFEHVRAFNQNAPIKMALDPTLYPEIVGQTADVYVVEKKLSVQWQEDPALLDVTADGPLSVTFTGGTIQANTFQITGPNELDAVVFQAVTGDFTGLGHGYDMVVDMNRNGLLDGGDFIDGYRREAGLYVCHDTTQTGPLAVTEVLDNVSTLYGIPGGYGGEDIYYPTNIASMGQLPLLVISHGNGQNYQWYDHIGHHMASYGFVVMSHANNTVPGPLEASLTTCGHTDAFLERLPNIAGAVLVGHVDGGRIIWTGHGRGAEGAVIAYQRISDFPPTYTPEHYSADSIVMIDGMMPTDIAGPGWSPGPVNYHVWLAPADLGVIASETFHSHERATRYRQSTFLQGSHQAWFDDYTGPEWIPGSCLIFEAGTHLVQLGLMLPMYKHYAEGNVPGEDYLWRMYEHFHPAAVPVGIDPCYVVSQDYRNGNEAGIAYIDDYESHPETDFSSSGGAVSYDVTNLAEGRLADGDGNYTWTSSDPFNGCEQDGPNDPYRGVTFDWYHMDRHYQWAIVPGLQDFSTWKYISLRGAQTTNHPYTIETNGLLTFSITLEDAAGHTGSINTGAYGGGFGMPYAREGGSPNEMRRVRIRIADFLANGSSLDLTSIVAVRLDCGPSWGTPQGHIVIDEMMLDVDLTPFSIPMTIGLTEPPPEFLPPHVPAAFDVEIAEGDDTLVAGSALLYYRLDGGDWITAPLQRVAGEVWRGTLPALLCNQRPEYYFAATGEITGTMYAPADAPRPRSRRSWAITSAFSPTISKVTSAGPSPAWPACFRACGSGLFRAAGPITRRRTTTTAPANAT